MSRAFGRFDPFRKAGAASADSALLSMAFRRLPPHLREAGHAVLDWHALMRGMARGPSKDQGRRTDAWAAFEQVIDGRPPLDPELAAALHHDTQVWPFLAPALGHMVQASRREMQARRSGAVLYPAWSDFHHHARFSHVPIGGFLQSVNAHRQEAVPHAVEAIMTAVALTGALQEAPALYRAQALLVLPAQWFAQQNTSPGDMLGRRASSGVQAVYRAGLARLDELLAMSNRLSQAPGDVGVAWRTARTLIDRLRLRLAADKPLRGSIRLGLRDRWAVRRVS